MTTVPFLQAKRAIVATGSWLDSKGWAPATSGNYSCRLDDGSFAVTVSGRHKGRLTDSDVMRVNRAGQPLDNKRPSAETALHLAVYDRFPAAGVVLHSHSSTAVGLTRAFRDVSGWVFASHEMIKAIPGMTTHETEVMLPIVDNNQDMTAIWHAASPLLGPMPAFLIRDHGLYAWGADLAEAERVIEAVEWMIAADLAAIQFRNGS